MEDKELFFYVILVCAIGTIISHFIGKIKNFKKKNFKTKVEDVSILPISYNNESEENKDEYD